MANSIPTAHLASTDITLKYGESSAVTQIYIKDFPDMGSAPEQAETTCFANSKRTYIKALEGTDSLTFTINYDADTVSTINALKKAQKIELGLPDGKYTFTGELSAYVTGKGVGDVLEAAVVIIPNTELTFTKVTTSGT